MTWQELFTYLDNRGRPYGITPEEMIDAAPTVIAENPSALMSFWQRKDISHIIPVSVDADLANDPDNWIPEDPGINRSRQDDDMELHEELISQADNHIDALWDMAVSLIG